MKVVKPAKLSKGDVIGLISPASSPDDVTRIERAAKYFESAGYRVKPGKHLGKYHGYLAGTDEERLEDLHDMFGDKNVKAVICLRGGYGSPRLLGKISYKIISKNPKIFVGYSDITSLQMAFLARCGLVTFAGPMAAVDFHSSVEKYTEEIFWRMVTSDKAPGDFTPDVERETIFHGDKDTEGRIIGGNLALFCASAGTPYLPSLKNKIVLTEDIGEPPYRIDRLLNQLMLLKGWDRVNGLIAGVFSDSEEPDKEKRTLTAEEVFTDYFGRLNVPYVTNFPHGHIKRNHTIPFGVNVKISPKKKRIRFLESAVI